jgi:hypothetical protein
LLRRNGVSNSRISVGTVLLAIALVLVLVGFALYMAQTRTADAKQDERYDSLKRELEEIKGETAKDPEPEKGSGLLPKETPTPKPEKEPDSEDASGPDSEDAAGPDSEETSEPEKTPEPKTEEPKPELPGFLMDIAPAYQSGGDDYKEYSSKESGGKNAFSMGGDNYTDGIKFEGAAWAVYNLKGNYKTLEFTICHIDGTPIGQDTSLLIYYDTVLYREISLSADMAPLTVSLDLSGVSNLKFETKYYNNSSYGMGNPILY